MLPWLVVIKSLADFAVGGQEGHHRVWPARDVRINDACNVSVPTRETGIDQAQAQEDTFDGIEALLNRQEVARMLGLYRERYECLTVKHYHEQLVKRHGYKLGYPLTKVHLQRARLVVQAAKGSALRQERPCWSTLGSCSRRCRAVSPRAMQSTMSR
jgi:hypothetical protein